MLEQEPIRVCLRLTAQWATNITVLLWSDYPVSKLDDGY